MSGLDIFIIDRKQAEDILAKVADLGAAVETLTAKVNDAVALLNAPPPTPVDDPALQPLVDKVSAAAQQLDQAVTTYKSAHPTT